MDNNIEEIDPRYKIGERVARPGSRRVVYMATDRFTGQVVALELLPRTTPTGRIQSEALTVAKLIHPNVVQVMGSGETPDGIPFVVMEYVSGNTLDQLIQQGRLSVLSAISIARQIANVLVLLDNLDIVHRDLSPSNIFVDEHGVVKIATGIGRLLSSNRLAPGPDDSGQLAVSESAGRGLGHYDAPELAEGHNITIQSDVFSFGVVLYLMLTGSHPFSAATGADLVSSLSNRTEPRPSRLVSTIPKYLDDIVIRCLSMRQEERFVPRELVLALDNAEGLFLGDSQVGSLSPDSRLSGRDSGVSWLGALCANNTLVILIAEGACAGVLWLIHQYSSLVSPRLGGAAFRVVGWLVVTTSVQALVRQLIVAQSRESTRLLAPTDFVGLSRGKNLVIELAASFGLLGAGLLFHQALATNGGFVTKVCFHGASLLMLAEVGLLFASYRKVIATLSRGGATYG